MAFTDFVKKQFIDVIEWLEEADGVLAYRYPMRDREIQTGAQLTVRESQSAVFINEGAFADQFGPGRYRLSTHTLPLLTNLNNWDKLFQSPFKSDVYFFSTRLQLDRKWGTPEPIIVRDKDFGAVRVSAFGIYSFRIADPKLFHQDVSGTRELYSVEDLDGQLREAMTGAVSNALGAAGVPLLDMAGNQSALAQAVRGAAEPTFAKLGLALASMVIENISVPEEIQKMLDARIGVNMMGDLNKYAQFQTANAMPIAAANPGSGLASMGANLAAGVNIGNQMASTLMANQKAAGSSAEEISVALEKLHALVGKGILSQAEFDAKKAELLGKLR
jgi:membrane protease subunit (stomatin/prohibitin family)